MVINETLARAAYGDADPIGKRMICCEGSAEDPMWKTVVGVVGDVKGRGPAQPPRPEFYLPLMQLPDVAWTWFGRTLTILTRGDDPASMTTAIRASVRSLDSTLPVFAIRTMDEGLDRIMAQARFNTMLMTLLAATGLVLAALGIYSVIAWLVAQRTREIGVRMALGASKRDVIRMMSVHGLKPVIAGLAVGVAGRVGDDAVTAEPVVRSRPARSAHVAGNGNRAVDCRRRGGGDSRVARHRDRPVNGVARLKKGSGIFSTPKPLLVGVDALRPPNGMYCNY